jgi:hypothetical protein
MLPIVLLLVLFATYIGSITTDSINPEARTFHSVVDDVARLHLEIRSYYDGYYLPAISL